MEDKKYTEINFQEDLVSLAKKQIEFLAFVDSENSIHVGETIDRAIYRYERFWLPFCAYQQDINNDLSKLYPPIDVAWVWHSHLLCPTKYIIDCQAVCNRVIDHTCLGMAAIRHGQKEATELWESYTGASFDYAHSNSVGGKQEEFKLFESRITYALKSACVRQKDFYYQVSLPHFTNDEFLKLCLERYKKFLYLKKVKSNEFIVPCYGIDIIWHTHQLCPKSYAQETSQFLGHVFPHDDTVNDRTPGSRLNTCGDRTRQLWKEVFGEDFFFAGVMYRGERPHASIFAASNKNFDFSSLFVKAGSIFLVENRLVVDRDVKYAEKTRFNMVVTQNSKTIHQVDLRTYDVTRLPESIRFDQLDEKTLDLRVRLSCVPRGSLSAKLLNALKSDFKAASNTEAFFEPKLVLPMHGVQNQNVAFRFDDARGNEYTLEQKWKIETTNDKSVRFDMVAQETFEYVHMIDVMYEYEAFDLKNRNVGGARGDGVRARHALVSTINSEEKVSLFQIDLLHIVALQWSSVKVVMNEKLLAAAHLIGWAQLPSNEQIKKETSACVTLDPRSEKAMLVRNLRGDYAVVKAKWTGLRRGIPPWRSSSGKKGVPGEPGRLQASIKFLENKKSYTVPISLDTPYQFESEHLKMTVDMKTGRIQAKYLSDTVRELEIESNLAIVFAISVMHVILQPKPPPYLLPTTTTTTTTTTTPTSSVPINPYYNDPNIHQSNPGYRGFRPIKSIPMDSYVLLKCVGYKDLINLPSTYRLYSESRSINGCESSSSWNTWFADGFCSISTNTNDKDIFDSEVSSSEWVNTGCGGCGSGDGCGVSGAEGNGTSSAAGVNFNRESFTTNHHLIKRGQSTEDGREVGKSRGEEGAGSLVGRGIIRGRGDRCSAGSKLPCGLVLEMVHQGPDLSNGSCGATGYTENNKGGGRKCNSGGYSSGGSGCGS